MIDSSRVLASLQREFPAPRIDPAWIQACAQALADDGQEPSLHNIREQFLFSDLSSSTIPSNLIPPEAHQTLLFPTPTLVQLVSITEIGHSAFQLQTIQEQRKDVLSGVTRIRRMEDEEEELDEGKLPAYPRGMLEMQVTDGERVIEALEYKRLPGIKLAETPLGAKLVLHKVKALRAILMLTPENTQFLGYEVAHLEAQQPVQFTNSLLERMGKSAPREDEAPRQVRPTQTARRLTLPPAAPAAPPRPRQAPPPPIASPYFQNRNAASSSRTTTRTPIQAVDEDDSFYDDSFIRQIDAAEARATLGSNNRMDQSSDYGLDDDFDPGILDQLDEVEMQARRQSSIEDEIEWVDAGAGARGNSIRTRRKRKMRVDSDDEKENRPDVIEVSD